MNGIRCIYNASDNTLVYGWRFEDAKHSTISNNPEANAYELLLNIEEMFPHH